MALLVPGFYWIRIYDGSRPTDPWEIREFDGWFWQGIGPEEPIPSPWRLNAPIPPCIHGPILEPADNGREIVLWEQRPLGFYWMFHPTYGGQAEHWTIAEFKGEHWAVMDSGDDAWNDNDFHVHGHTISGPLRSPWSQPSPRGEE